MTHHKPILINNCQKKKLKVQKKKFNLSKKKFISYETEKSLKFS